MGVVALVSELACLASGPALAHHGLVFMRVGRRELLSGHLLHVLFLAFAFW